MTRPVAARGGRLLGRSLRTLANAITLTAPVAADWNDSHIVNERWPGHARFHGVTALAMATVLSSVNIWSIWSGPGDRSDPGGRRVGHRPPIGARGRAVTLSVAPARSGRSG
jgi:hypothetical protein